MRGQGRNARRIMARMAQTQRESRMPTDEPINTDEFTEHGEHTFWWAMLWPVALELAAIDAAARDPQPAPRSITTTAAGRRGCHACAGGVCLTPETCARLAG